MNKHLYKNQAGFTLIELIMVIVILGVLAAVALPKFVGLGGEARAGVMRGVQASMQSANTMIYAKAAANNQLGATGSVTITGVGTVALKHGYAEDLTALLLAVNLTPSTDFTPTNTAGSGGTIDHANATTVTSCRITYTGATGATVPPTYVPLLTGC